MATLLGTQLNTFDLETVGGSNSVNDFRLSLDSASAVTTTDMTGKSVVYMTPLTGNRISLYTGSAWSILTSSQVSYTLSALTSDRPYDLFAYNSGGTLTLEAVAWTNDTTRATALAYQDGIACKTGTLTKRYVGTFRTTSTTTTEDSIAKRFLFNANNRALRSMSVVETTDSWTYASTTWRSANNSTTNRLQFVLGLAEAPVKARVLVMANYNGGRFNCGVALDATNANHARLTLYQQQGAAGFYAFGHAEYVASPAVGFHYLQWVEVTDGGTATYYGDAGSAGDLAQSGIMGEVWA